MPLQWAQQQVVLCPKQHCQLVYSCPLQPQEVGLLNIFHVVLVGKSCITAPLPLCSFEWSSPPPNVIIEDYVEYLEYLGYLTSKYLMEVSLWVKSKKYRLGLEKVASFRLYNSFTLVCCFQRIPMRYQWLNAWPLHSLMNFFRHPSRLLLQSIQHHLVRGKVHVRFWFWLIEIVSWLTEADRSYHFFCSFCSD